MKSVLFKIKDNKLGQWKKWCEELNTIHREEALKTLAEENFLFEGFVMFQIGSEFYTLGVALEKRGGGKTADENNLLNKKHYLMKSECLEKISKGEASYFLME